MDISESRGFLSQGTMEEVFGVVSPEELDRFLKIEPPFQHDSIQTYDESEEPYVFGETMNLVTEGIVLPDSTEHEQQIVCVMKVPSPTCRLPSTEDYPGSCEFNIEINNISGRSKWEYSAVLNKMYVCVGSKVPINFKWNQNEVNLKVRALPIFLHQDYFAEPVKRCMSHSLEAENKGFGNHKQLILCDNINTIYEEDEESRRLSTLAPLDLPQPGTSGTTLVYTFMCKNSCPVGMNRRSTAIIFTLERENGLVIGRKLLKMRVCSCPKRDLKKEELELNVKRDGPDAEGHVESRSARKIIMKKTVKRLGTNEMENVNIPIPKIYSKQIVKVIRDIISLPQSHRELTREEKITVEFCNKYLV